MLQTLPPTHLQLHVCVTCHHHPILTGIYDFNIYQEHENEQDISTYVQGKLAMSSELTASRIPASITFHASGNFIWARLITERVLDLDLEGDGLEKIFEAVNFAPPPSLPTISRPSSKNGTSLFEIDPMDLLRREATVPERTALGHGNRT